MVAFTDKVKIVFLSIGGKEQPVDSTTMTKTAGTSTAGPQAGR